MTSEAGIEKYIKEWLEGLNIGKVFLDREAFGDATKLQGLSTYIVVDFPDGITDVGPWWEAKCEVCIGCRDKKRFVAGITELDNACSKFVSQFDMNDDENGIQCLSYEFLGKGQYVGFSHEYQYVFDIYAQKSI